MYPTSTQVNGFVEDVMGKKVATLFGKWDDSMYYVNNDGSGKPKDCTSSDDAALLWKKSKPPPSLTRYNLTSFAITLNELTPRLQVDMMYQINFLSIFISLLCIYNCFFVSCV